MQKLVLHEALPKLHFKEYYGIFRNGLLGASICAVPLSQPIPVKNYF